MISLAFLLDFMGYGAPFGRLLLVQYLVSLILLPRLWHSASFQLTFGCLFGILIFPRMVERFKPKFGSWIDAAWNYFTVSLGACLGTIPTTWIVFGEINFTSLATNWFAVPPVSFIIMPLGLAQILMLAPHLPAGDSAAVTAMVHALAKVSALTTIVLKKTLVYWLRLIPPLRYVD
jgi:predicted membrane metal-binding protein